MNSYGDLADRLIYDLTAERDRARAEVANVRTYERQKQSVLGVQLVDAEERADAVGAKLGRIRALVSGELGAAGSVQAVRAIREILQEEA